MIINPVLFITPTTHPHPQNTLTTKNPTTKTAPFPGSPLTKTGHNRTYLYPGHLDFPQSVMPCYALQLCSFLWHTAAMLKLVFAVKPRWLDGFIRRINSEGREIESRRQSFASERPSTRETKHWKQKMRKGAPADDH